MNDLLVSVDPQTSQDPTAWRVNLGIVLRRYGLWGIDIGTSGASITPRLKIVNSFRDMTDRIDEPFHALFLDRIECPPYGLICKPEPAGQSCAAQRDGLGSLSQCFGRSCRTPVFRARG